MLTSAHQAQPHVGVHLPRLALPAEHAQRDEGVEHVREDVEDIAALAHFPRHKQRGRLLHRRPLQHPVCLVIIPGFHSRPPRNGLFALILQNQHPIQLADHGTTLLGC
jgi:hypothetical protein